MEDHAENELGAAIAAEVRSEMAAQLRTVTELANVLRVTPHTVGRRLSAKSWFNVNEMATTAMWLGLTPDVLVARAQCRIAAEAVAS